MYVLEVCRCIQNPARHIVAGQCGHHSCPVGHKYPPQSRSFFFFSPLHLPLRSLLSAFVYQFSLVLLQSSTTFTHFVFFYFSISRSLALSLSVCNHASLQRQSGSHPILSTSSRVHRVELSKMCPFLSGFCTMDIDGPNTKRLSVMGSMVLSIPEISCATQTSSSQRGCTTALVVS